LDHRTPFVIDTCRPGIATPICDGRLSSLNYAWRAGVWQPGSFFFNEPTPNMGCRAGACPGHAVLSRPAGEAALQSNCNTTNPGSRLTRYGDPDEASGYLQCQPRPNASQRQSVENKSFGSPGNCLRAKVSKLQPRGKSPSKPGSMKQSSSGTSLTRKTSTGRLSINKTNYR